MVEQLTIDIPSEELTIDIPEEAPKKRVSNPGKQAVASVIDLVTELPGFAGLIGAGGQAGYNYLTDGSDKGFGEQFSDASSEGGDAWLMEQSSNMRKGTNELLGIQEPTSTEDILARNAALFLPIPGPSKIEALGKLGKFGAGLINVALPTVKSGTKANMLGRAAIQGTVGAGIDQGVRALVDDPVNLPLLLSDTALAGGITPQEQARLNSLVTDPNGMEEDLTYTTRTTMQRPISSELVIDLSEDLEINIPESSVDEIVQDQLDTDIKMEKENDWNDVRNVAIAVGALIGGSYLTTRLRGPVPLDAPVKPNPKFSSGKYLHETMLDKGKVVNHVFDEMGTDDITRAAIDNDIHTDVNGIARESVNEGMHGQGFDNKKWKSYSAAVLDSDEAALKQQGKDTLFNDAMKAQSELSAVRKGKRERSLFRKDITDQQLDSVVTKARADGDIAALMNKHAQNYRADIEYEVFRGFTTRQDADDIIGIFGDITKKGEVGTYMPFYGQTPADFTALMARKFLGINTKKGDELRTVAEFQARSGGTSAKLANASEAMKRHRLHNVAYVNEQLYKHNILTKMAGIAFSDGKLVRTALKNGKFVSSNVALKHSQTGRQTHLIAIGDDVKTDPNNIAMKTVKKTDDKEVDDIVDQSINDLRAKYGKELVAVHHKGKLYAYRVPDQGVRASLELSPKLNKVLEFNNHWKNVFTKFTTGDYSLFAPISHVFSAQQVASTTAAREGTLQGFKSYGRSLGGSKDIFMDQMAGTLSNYLIKAIATNRGWGKNAHTLQATMHNRYSNSLLAKVRSETGRTTTGIGTTDASLQEMIDQFGPSFSNFYGAEQMGLVKNVLKAFNNAANEGPAYGVIQREIGKVVQEGKTPNIPQIRKAVEQGKTLAGDMSRRGSSSLAVGINASIPFSSAMLQSWNALGSAAKYDWKAFAVGAGALIGAPTLMELGMNAALNKTGMTFKDASGKDWTYDDYYWNGYTTQQRTDNAILFVPGKPPWEAIVFPISPEWGLMRAITIETADALFNLSATGNIEVADKGEWKVGRDHFIGSLHRVLDLPLPPLSAGILSGMGIDIRAGFHVSEGDDPENPSTGVGFLQALPIGTGERVSGRMGRTKDVNGSIDKNVSAAIKDIFGAGGTAYVAFHEAINGGMTNKGGSLGRGLSQGVESVLDSARRQARYTQPLFGKTFKPTSNDEIGITLYNKKQALLSLSNDAKILSGGEGYVKIDGKDVAIDTVVPTQDPIRIDLATSADVVKGNVSMLDDTISKLRSDITRMGISTSFNSQRERQDYIDGKQLEIQAYKAQQLAAIHTFESIWSEQLTKKYNRDITVDLKGGIGKTIGARPNLNTN